MHVFYTPDIASDQYTLNEEESIHCVRVLRLGMGDAIQLIDGKGGLYQAKITSLNKKHVTVEVLEKHIDPQKRNYSLHIAIAPTKNIERLEWFIEKATEIGIDEITPLLCEHSERKVVKEERLNKIITSAVKQSLQSYHPKLHPLTPFNEFLKRDTTATRMIAHCMEDSSKQTINDINSPEHNYLILIGPEGDFSPNEIAFALECGFKPLTLGNTRLRTETAALAACFEVNYLNR